MRSRDLAGGRSILRPSAGTGDLAKQPASFAGEFDIDSALVAGGDQTRVVGEGTVERSVVQQVDLSGATLGPLGLSDTVLRDVDLSNASVQQLVLRRTEWQRCRAIGLRLSIELAADFYAEDCRLDYATVHIERVTGAAAFVGCSFREATVRGNLSNVLFLDCDFVDTEFRAGRADRCDLRGSRFAGGRGLLTLRGATISTDQVVSICTLIAAEAGLQVAD
jgi:uncharacterized protein YjbI with pentapeptide repeats